MRNEVSSNLKDECAHKINNNGITLIALVITTIILLILAGVTIMTITGDDGILSRANKSVESMNFKSAKEKLELELINIKTDLIADGKEINLSALDERKDELQKQGITIASSGTPREVTLEGYMFKVNNDLVIDELGNQVGDVTGDIENIDKNEPDIWINWLLAANVDYKNYNSTTILTNESLMNELMNNENAVNYMIKSTGFIVPGVANSEVAMTELGKSSYLKNILKQTDLLNILKNSAYSGKIEENLDKNYTMTSASDDNAEVTASSEEGTSYTGWKAFDGMWTWQNGWISLEVPQNVTYRFKNKSIVPYKFIIMGNSTTDNADTGSAYIEGSKDGQTWKEITGSFSLPPTQKVTVYATKNIDEYSYFKMTVTTRTGTYGRNKAVISEWEIYGK